MKIGNPALLNNLDLNYLQRRIFQLVIIFYPINYLPLNLPLVGGSLPLLFLLIGYFTFIVELIIRPVIFTKQEKIGILFLLISSLWYLITALIGVESYQYYHFIDITQNEKLQMLFLEINKWGSYDSLLVIKGWLAFLGIRSAVPDTLFAYSITLWFYHIYKSDFKKAFQDTFKAIKILCLIISLYSLVEVGYLLGDEFCKYV